jgi:hypothetical protein
MQVNQNSPRQNLCFSSNIITLDMRPKNHYIKDVGDQYPVAGSYQSEKTAFPGARFGLAPNWCARRCRFFFGFSSDDLGHCKSDEKGCADGDPRRRCLSSDGFLAGDIQSLS